MLTINVIISAIGMLSQMPSCPMIGVSKNMGISTKTMLRQRAMTTDSKGRSMAVWKLQAEQIHSHTDASTKKQSINQQRLDSSVVLGTNAVRHQGIHGLRQPENRHVDDEIEVADDGERRHTLGANLTHQHKVKDIGRDRRRDRGQHLR